jgi:uncharacterized OB-fold protein
MSGYSKPLPAPSPETQPFWDACKAHEFRAQQCSSCGAFRWPPAGLCPQCRSWDFEWTTLPGTGRVYSFVAVHYVSVQAFFDDVPYVIANICMDGTDENVIFLSNVIGIPWEQVKVGMPVKVLFDDVTKEITLPKFKPVT